MRSLPPLLFCGIVLLVVACKPEKEPEAKSAWPSNLPEHGHALLFELLGDEKNVSKLLIIKKESTELKALVKDISEIAGQGHQRLEAFGKGDARLNLKDNGLPPAEVIARKAIAKTKAKSLIEEKGAEFELRLLLSQNEALTYGANLAATTALRDSDPDRARALQDLAADLDRLQERVVSLLLTNFSESVSKP